MYCRKRNFFFYVPSIFCPAVRGPDGLSSCPTYIKLTCSWNIYIDRRVTPLRRVTSPSGGAPTPCKQAQKKRKSKRCDSSGWAKTREAWVGVRPLPFLLPSRLPSVSYGSYGGQNWYPLFVPSSHLFVSLSHTSAKVLISCPLNLPRHVAGWIFWFTCYLCGVSHVASS